MSDQPGDGKVSSALKWVGYLTAILSLSATIFGIVKVVADRVETKRKIDTLLSSEQVELRGRDYLAAWQTLEEALKLKPDSSAVLAAQQSLANAWVEDFSIQGSEKYSGFADKLDPVLASAVASSKPGPDRADLLSHLGWVYALQRNEGKEGLDIPGTFGRAVAEDPKNPYAHALWGYWIMTTHGKLADAEQHFAMAMDSHRLGDYVRRLQLDALTNCSTEECDEESIRVATAMRKEGRNVDVDTRFRFFRIYYFQFIPQPTGATHFIDAVPRAEHVATFLWLTDGLDLDESKTYSRTYYLAVLQDAAGQRDDALANNRVARDGKPKHDGSVWDVASAAIKRLSNSH